MSCEPLLSALKDCLLRSDCVVKDGRLPSDCLKHHLDELPEECRSLRKATFECKRGLVRHFFLFYFKQLSQVDSLICENDFAGTMREPPHSRSSHKEPQRSQRSSRNRLYLTLSPELKEELHGISPP